MPFGLDLKSFLIGGVFVWFIVPWVLGALAGHKKKSAA